MNFDDVMHYYDMPLMELAAIADRTRRVSVGNDLALCSIINARSGLCGEDCRFCAQSARHATGVPQYPMKSADEIVEAARRARDAGSDRFGIVTSGRALGREDIITACRAISRIRDEIGMDVCASLGCVDREAFSMLADAGLTRYHHNIETSPEFFPNIVTTHAFADRLRTIEAASDTGLSVCSGGIFGLGETRADRAAMALALHDLPVDSVPVNVLMPVPGTPLASAAPISAVEVIKAVAIFRLVMPGSTIKVAAGRHTALGDWQGMAFMAGANGMIIGDYLTQCGRSPEADSRLAEEIRAAWSR